MKRFLLVVLVIVVAAAAAYFALAAVYSVRLARTRRALAAAGHPVNLADLAPFFAAGSDEAGDLYLAAAAGFEKHALGRLVLYDSIGWREDPRGLDSLLRARAAPLTALLAATRLGPARFGYDFERGWHTRLVAPLPQFRTFHTLLALHARALMNHRDADSALAVLGRAFALTEALSEPLLVHWLVGLAGQDTALALLARAAPHAGIAALDRAIADLSGPDLVGPMRRALQSEIVFTQDALARGHFLGTIDETGRTVDYPWHLILPLRRYVQWRQLEVGRVRLDLILRPWYESRAAIARLDSGLAGPGLARRLVRDASSATVIYADRAARIIAQRDAAVYALRLVRFRREHGRLPADPTEAAGALPLDPFTGEAMVFRAEPGGFVVYSLGRNVRDDDGDPGLDIALRVRWPSGQNVGLGN